MKPGLDISRMLEIVNKWNKDVANRFAVAMGVHRRIKYITDGTSLHGAGYGVGQTALRRRQSQGKNGIKE